MADPVNLSGESTTPPVPVLVPVVYPEGASGSAEVVLELTVDAEGRVERAAYVEGRSDFGSAAAAQALAWRFDPARRGGAPVAARIRFSVRFTERAAAGPETSAPMSAAASPIAAESEGTEVVVRGQRPTDSAVRLTRTDTRQLPGALGDPFRAIEATPGVTPVALGIPFSSSAAPPAT